MDFVGIDPDSPDEECPAVFVDHVTGDLFFKAASSRIRRSSSGSLITRRVVTMR